MSYISTSIPVSPVPAISTVGTDNVYVSLHMRRLGQVIELRAVAVSYNAYSGQELRDEIGCELVDEEEAIDAATDLQHLAHVYLDERGDRGYVSPHGFGEAVEKALDAAERQDGIDYPAAAE